MQDLMMIVAIGIGATAVTDLWALLRRRLWSVPVPDFALIGRWFAHMRNGRFRHESITAATPVRGERALGWLAHYLIGIAFAALAPVLCGPSWLRHPTPLPALGIGLATVAAPWLLMQPALGAGIAARRTPHPLRVRLHSLLTHLAFGVGLYMSAWTLSRLVLIPFRSL